MEQRKEQSTLHFMSTNMPTKHDYLRLTDVTVKLCQKYPVSVSLLLANMLASYTLKGSAGKHFRVF